MFTDEEMLQITNAVNAGLKEVKWELADFKDEVYKRFDAMDKKIDTKIEALDKKIDTKIEALDKKFEARMDAMDKKFEARMDAMDKKFEARMDAMDKKFEARFTASEEENGIKFETIDRRFEAIDRRFDVLSEQIMENRLILDEVLKTVNASHKKYQKSAESVEWCDMQIRIIGNVVSEHSEKIARVEEKIAEYETGKKQDGDSISSGKGKKRG